MKLVTPIRSLLTLAALALVAVAPASSAPVTAEPISGYFGDIQATPEGGSAARGQSHPVTNVNVTIYDNSAAPANFGFASTDPLAAWGDELITTGTGILSTNKFTIFNAGSSAGPLLTATVNVSFFNAVTSAFLGGYNTNINFGAGLNPGFFSTVTVTPLSALLINLNVSDIVVIQTITAKTGTASNLGIASRTPPAIGTSPATMYISATTVGPAGFYTVTGQIANPGYQVVIDDNPVPNRSTSWGRVKGLYR